MAEESGSSGPEGRLEGRYTNAFRVGFNGFEFVIEFGQEYEAANGATHTRIVTTPFGAKALSALLEGSIRKYEARFGEIKGDLPDCSAGEG